MNKELKECPFCAEEIKINAKKCKYCGETIDVTLRIAEDAKSSNNSPNVYMNAAGGASSSSSINDEETSIGINTGMDIALKNEFGQVKYFKTGFSWKVLFFGILVPIFQGEIVYGLVWLVSWIFIIPILMMPFLYNYGLIKKYVNKGYRPMNKATQNYLASKKIHTEIIK